MIERDFNYMQATSVKKLCTMWKVLLLEAYETDLFISHTFSDKDLDNNATLTLPLPDKHTLLIFSNHKSKHTLLLRALSGPSRTTKVR